MLAQGQTLKERIDRLDALLMEVESLPDTDTQAMVVALIQSLLEFYGEALSRLLAIAGKRDPELLDAFSEDSLVSHLLLLHDLHPADQETRVRRALEQVRPYLLSHGGNVELLGIEEGVVRLRLQGSCRGCASSTTTLQFAIEDAIQNAAPDIVRIDADGTDEPPSGFIPLTSLKTKPGQSAMVAPSAAGR